MIELKNIHKTYRMGEVEVKALCGVSLAISRGEFIAIMGPSGSGKSTLMHILGLLDRPDSGVYYLEGNDLTVLSERELSAARNNVVGFIFQQFHLLSRMSALENVELPLIYAGKTHLKEKAREKIDLVGLSDRMSHRPTELSGGQQQRVAIARALVNEPLIILADEPTGNLDSRSQEEIISVLKRLNQEGKTVIIVTHEKEVASCAKRIIYIRDGRIVSDESIEPKGGVETADSQGITFKPSYAMGGMKLFDYFRQAGLALLTHKMRAALSILGILIGVAAVIAMLALGEGAKISIQKRLASLGANLLLVRPGSTRAGGVALEAGLVTRFTAQDLSAITNLSGLVDMATPSVIGRAQLVYLDKNWNTLVEGTGAEYEKMRASTPVAGRFFNEQELKLQEKVALLGPTVASELFGEANPVGETIKVNLINFKVIGVLPTKGGSSFRDQDDLILMPVTTAMNRVFGKDYYDTIYVEVKSSDLLDEAQEAIRAIIKRQHRLTKDQEGSFQIFNMADIRSAVEATTKTMSVLLGCIAAISLLVGGIGIMNIMLVSVTERTREIGLRKAIGATNRDIMTQFLIEAVLLSLLGGIGGFLLGSGASLLITFFAGWTVAISPFSVALATIFSLVVGIIFGIWPAQKASTLDPIEALRYE